MKMLVLKKEVLAQSNEVIAAATEDKISQVARYKVATCEDIDIMVVIKGAKIKNFSGVSMHIELAE